MPGIIAQPWPARFPESMPFRFLGEPLTRGRVKPLHACDSVGAPERGLPFSRRLVLYKLCSDRELVRF
jgi:hypothetical protein